MLEMARQVRLIVEAGLRRGQARRHSVQQKPPRQIDPAARQVLVRADPELPAEHPDQMGGMGVQLLRRLPERHLLVEPDVDQVPQVSGHADVRAWRTGLDVLAQVAAESFGDECQPVLRLEFLAWQVQDAVQLVNALPEKRIGQHGLVHGPADQAGRQLGEVKIDDSLAEAGSRGGAPVMRNLRGQQRDKLI